jgi:hypothetical protein
MRVSGANGNSVCRKLSGGLKAALQLAISADFAYRECITIEIKPEDEKLIAEKLRSGAFRSAEDLIHQALIALPTP